MVVRGGAPAGRDGGDRQVDPGGASERFGNTGEARHCARADLDLKAVWMGDDDFGERTVLMTHERSLQAEVSLTHNVTPFPSFP